MKWEDLHNNNKRMVESYTDALRDIDDEPTVACNSCGQGVVVGDTLYDGLEEAYYCDKDCFLMWADSNSEVVTEYYYRRNCE